MSLEEERTCATKRQYTLSDAKQAVLNFNKNGKAPNVHQYICSICKYWHLTSLRRNASIRYWQRKVQIYKEIQ